MSNVDIIRALAVVLFAGIVLDMALLLSVAGAFFVRRRFRRDV